MQDRAGYVKAITAAVCALLVGACSDPSSTIGEATLASISDGTHGGNASVFFLPPLVSEPNPGGTFDATLSPEVRICAWEPAANRCGIEVATFTSDAGPGNEKVRLEALEEAYVTNWHIDDIPEGIDTYRIRLYVDGRELAYIDVKLVNNGQEAKSVDTDEYIPLKDGRSIAIRFRIEEGALALGQTFDTGWGMTCRLTSEGKAFCSGANIDGQLGSNSPGGSTPAAVAGDHTFQSIDLGDRFACGLTTGGEIYCWGSSYWGQLGDGKQRLYYWLPGKIASTESFQAVSAGSFHACALTTGGKAYCWGANWSGQLGNGSYGGVEYTPVAVTGNHTFQQLKAGAATSCGITTGGKTLCWGHGGYGELGNGVFASRQTTPVEVVGGHSFKSLSLGSPYHICGVTTSGEAYCWGAGLNGQLGNGTTTRYQNTPVKVEGGLTFAEVDVGGVSGNPFLRGHTCGITPTGAAYCWGWGWFGERGDNSFVEVKSLPAAVVGGHTFKSISTGLWHSCGMRVDDELYCWGSNYSGELGASTSYPRVPYPVPAMELPTL